MWRQIRWMAIVAGYMVDISGSFLANLLLGIAWVFGGLYSGAVLPGREPDLLHDPGFLLASLVVGLVFSALGGYVAGRIAKDAEEVQGIALGVVGVIFGLFFIRGLPIWFDILGCLATIPVTMWGASRAKVRRLRITAPGKS